MKWTILVVLTTCAAFSADTDSALAKIKESAKNEDPQRARWNFFEGDEVRANVLIKLRKETDRTTAAMKFLEERVKPAIPEEDWKLLKDRVERSAAAAYSQGARPTGDTQGKAFRYGTDAALQMESIQITFKSPRASATELERKAAIEAHGREAEGRAKASERQPEKPRTGE